MSSQAQIQAARRRKAQEGALSGVILLLGIAAPFLFPAYTFQVAIVTGLLVVVLVWRQIQMSRHRQVVQ